MPPLGLWTVQSPTAARPVSAVRAGESVVIGDEYGGVTAFGLEDGRRGWQVTGGTTTSTIDAPTEPESEPEPVAATPDLAERPPPDPTLTELLRNSFAGPLLVDGGAIVVTRVGGTVQALDGADGSERWRVTVPRPVSGVATVGGVLVVGAGDGVIGLDPATGTVAWRALTPGRLSALPVSTPRGVAITTATSLLLLDPVTGTEVWRVDMAHRITTGLAATGDAVVAGRSNGEVVAFDLADGMPAWRFTVGRAVSTAPVAHGGLVIVSSDQGGTYALDATTGAPLWVHAVGKVATMTPAVWGESVLVSSDRSLTALDLETGEPAWQFDRDVVYAGGFDESLLIGDPSGRVYMLGDPASPVFLTRNLPDPAGTEAGMPAEGGSSRRSFAPGTGPLGTAALTWTVGEDLVSSPPVVAGGLAIVFGDDAVLSAHDVVSGERAWRYAMTGRSVHTPAVIGETIVMALDDGTVEAIGLRDGASRWTRDDAAGQPAVGPDMLLVPVMDGVARIDPATGETMWEVAWQTGNSGAIGEAIAISPDGPIYLSGSDGLAAVEPASGTISWQVETGPGNPIAADGMVILAGLGLRAYDAAGGTIRYVSGDGKTRVLSAVVRHGHVYAQLDDGRVVAFDVMTGNRLWSREGPAPAAYPRGVVSTEGTLFASYATDGGSTQMLLALDGAGDERWRVVLPEGGGAHVAPPVIAYDMVFIGAGNLYAVTGSDNPPLNLPNPVTPDRPEIVTTGPTGDALAMVGGDLARSGRQTGPAPAAGAALLWEVTGTSAWTAPVVAGGVVYAGTEAGELVAIDSVDGAERWRYPGTGGPAGPPTVAGETVYAVAGREVVALDRGDGTLLWSYPGDFTGSPLVVGSTILIGTGLGITAWEEAGQRALPLWDYACQGACSEPIVAGESVLVNDAGSLVALDLSNGAEEWRTALGEVAMFGSAMLAPAAVEGMVVIGAGDVLHLADLADGQIRWSVDLGDAVSSPAAISDGLVVVGTDFGEVIGLDPATGTETWRYDAGDTVAGQPAIAGDTVVVTSLQGAITGLDAATGTERWEHDTGYESESAPVVVNGRAYAIFDRVLVAVG
ncbi:MAG: PQQ-binding-like beta-propeller repeat protein [Thermomicrobiales bacterium]